MSKCRHQPHNTQIASSQTLLQGLRTPPFTTHICCGSHPTLQDLRPFQTPTLRGLITIRRALKLTKDQSHTQQSTALPHFRKLREVSTDTIIPQGRAHARCPPTTAPSSPPRCYSRTQLLLRTPQRRTGTRCSRQTSGLRSRKTAQS